MSRLPALNSRLGWGAGGTRRRSRARHGRRFAAAVHQRKARLVTDNVVAPDLGDVDVVVFAEPARHVNHARGYVKVECGARLRVMCPLGERLEVIDRLPRLDLDDDLEAMSSVL